MKVKLLTCLSGDKVFYEIGEVIEVDKKNRRFDDKKRNCL